MLKLPIEGKNCCLNVSTVDLFLKNEPQSTSTKNMVHLAQSKFILPNYFSFNATDISCFLPFLAISIRNTDHIYIYIYRKSGSFNDFYFVTPFKDGYE